MVVELYILLHESSNFILITPLVQIFGFFNPSSGSTEFSSGTRRVLYLTLSFGHSKIREIYIHLLLLELSLGTAPPHSTPDDFFVDSGLKEGL